MTDVRHRELHFGVNYFGTCPKGELLDPAAGEWSGANQEAARTTGGRIIRVQLHSLDQAPHTGCGGWKMRILARTANRPGSQRTGTTQRA